MPLLKLHTSHPIAEDDQQALLKELSTVVSKTIGKPESYVMIALSQGPMCMGGQTDPAAFGDLRSIGGLSPEVNQQLSGKICAILADRLEIPSARVFLNFTDIARTHWGYDGRTFG